MPTYEVDIEHGGKTYTIDVEGPHTARGRLPRAAGRPPPLSSIANCLPIRSPRKLLCAKRTC